MFPRPPWFKGAKLNFAENLLFPTVPVDEDAVAVFAATEESRDTVTWGQLREKVRVYAAALSGKAHAGDRVVGKFSVSVVRRVGTKGVKGSWETTLKRWLRCWPLLRWARFGQA
jgi:acetoacetyl-CoA synthetase